MSGYEWLLSSWCFILSQIDVDLMFLKVNSLGVEKGAFMWFFVCSAHCSASSLGAPETARRQMQTMREGRKQLGNNLMFACYNLCYWGFPKFIELYSYLITWIKMSVQGFQQKFAFHSSKDIVAISCSWCKQAVSIFGLPADSAHFYLTIVRLNKIILLLWLTSLFSTTTKCPASCSSKSRRPVQ